MPSNKPSDQLVDAKAILEAIAELKRRGIHSLMQELEATERELAGYVMEEISLIHQSLAKTGATSKQIRRVMNQMESLLLVSILSLRTAQRRLWQDYTEEDPPANIPSTPDENSPI